MSPRSALVTGYGHIWRAHRVQGGGRLFVPYSADHIATRDRHGLWHAAAVKHLLDVAHRRRTLDTVCGVRARLESAPMPDADEFACLIWPTPGRAPWRRCPACHEATGRRRPHEMHRVLDLKAAS